MRASPRPHAIRTLVAETDAPLPAVDLGSAAEWRCVVTHRGVPCAYVAIPSPGPGGGPQLAHAAIARHAHEHLRTLAVHEAMRARLGPAPPAPPLSCAVVVCTHRRPGFLPGVLASVSALDPAPAEVIVVDNDPGEQDCRAVVEAAGARYVREDRRGLNRARAAGLRAARSDVVAFTDDDCLLPPGWLGGLPDLFADPTVAAVTGPGFAHELETIHQVQREEVAGFAKELRRRRYDWTNVWLVHAGRIGTGASMAFRRSAMPDADALFPPELDAGTITRSGGDLYALFAVLAAGHRIVYDPGSWFLHRHRPDWKALEDTLEGYGVGLSAFLSKALVEERELAGFAVWWWLWRSYARAVLSAASGHGDPEQVPLRWRYLRAGWRGMPAWRQAVRALPERSHPVARPARVGRGPADGPVAAPGTAPPGSGASPDAAPPGAVCVVIAGSDAARLRTCLAALAGQGAAEVVVASPVPSPPGTRWVATGDDGPRALAAGAAAARAPLVLLLDDRLVPAPGLVAAHARAHRDGKARRVVGGYSPLAAGGGLPAAASRLEREDHFRRAREAASPTAAIAELRNLSIHREDLEAIGGIRPLGGPLASGRELALRAAAAGLVLAHEPSAVAEDRAPSGARALLEDARQRGIDAALLDGAHAGAATLLPPPARPEGALGRAAVRLLARRPPRAAAMAGLHALERLRLRRSWHRVAAIARAGAYRAGVATVSPRGLPAPPTRIVDLADDEPIPPPGACPPVLEMRLGGRRVARVAPPGGHWHREIFGGVAARLREDEVELIPWAAAATAEVPPADETPVTVVLCGDAPAEALARAGATLAPVEASGDAVRDWAAVDMAARTAHTELVAIPLPGVTLDADPLDAIRVGLAGERTAALVGCGLHPHEAPGPVSFTSRHLRRAPYAAVDRPPQFVAIRRSRLVELGGLDSSLAVFGPHAPVLDLVERALDAGLTTAYCETPGIAPAGARRPVRSVNEFHAWRARGALLGREAARRGRTRGAVWLASRALLPRLRELWWALRIEEFSLRHWAGTSVALVLGLLTVAVGAARPRVGRAASRPRFAPATRTRTPQPRPTRSSSRVR